MSSRDHTYNRIKDQRNTEQGNIGPSHFVNGQNRLPFKDYRFGYGTVGKNGCLAMAVYNCNLLLGMYEGLSGIIGEIHRYYGMVLGGLLGGRPWILWPYYRKKGCRVSFRLFPTVQKMERSLAEEGCVGILLFWWWGKGIGAHYVTISYDGEKNQYKIYNEYQNAKSASVYPSLKRLKGNSFFVLFCKIKKRTGRPVRQSKWRRQI